jgi:hypothetical protein
LKKFRNKDISIAFSKINNLTGIIPKISVLFSALLIPFKIENNAITKGIYKPVWVAKPSIKYTRAIL